MEAYILHMFALMGAVVCSLLVLRFKDLLSCAIALGGCGFFVAWAYFAVRAPDLGVIQLLIEVIKMCILVLVVAKTHRVGFSMEPLRTRVLTASCLAIVFFCFVLFISPAISPFGAEAPELAKRYIRSGEKETGSGNLVTAILLGFRAYDTIGEVCVLFVSIMGISIILARRKGEV